MTDLDFISKLEKKYGRAILQSDLSGEFPVLTIDVASIFNFIEDLKNDYDFEFLTDICGVHYPEQEFALGVIYHLHKLRTNQRIRLKTFVSVEKPEVQSITPLFSAANWMERETYDFYGINFINHPNLIRILNVEFLDFFPMRKEYPLEDPTRDDKDNRFFGR